MNNKFVSIGFKNIVNSDKVVAVFSIEEKNANMLLNSKSMQIDATSGRQLKSIILTTSEQIILCGLSSDTILQRLNNIED